MDFQPNSTFANNWLQTDYSNSLFTNMNYDNENDFNDNEILTTWNDALSSPLTVTSSFYQQSPTSTLSDQSDDCFGFNSQSHIILPTVEGKSHQQTKYALSSEDDTEYVLPVDAPKRKRGRPRTNHQRRISSSASSNYTTSPKSSNRTPHNQVERKYREGLNSEMERLRHAISNTAHRESGSTSSLAGKPPSKAVILANAISYIAKIERERDCLLKENALLRQ